MEILLFGLSIIVALLPAVHAPSVFKFPNRLYYNRPLVIGDTWGFRGTFDGKYHQYHQDLVDAYGRYPSVQVWINTTRLCTIDTSKCPPSPLPTGDKICYCTGSTAGNSYFYLFAAITAKMSHSYGTIDANYSTNYNSTHRIGKLPAIIGKGYDEECSNELPCDDKKQLQCENGKCVCLTDTFFQKRDGKCDVTTVPPVTTGSTVPASAKKPGLSYIGFLGIILVLLM